MGFTEHHYLSELGHLIAECSILGAQYTARNKKRTVQVFYKFPEMRGRLEVPENFSAIFKEKDATRAELEQYLASLRTSV